MDQRHRIRRLAHLRLESLMRAKGVVEIRLGAVPVPQKQLAFAFRHLRQGRKQHVGMGGTDHIG